MRSKNSFYGFGKMLKLASFAPAFIALAGCQTNLGGVIDGSADRFSQEAVVLSGPSVSRNSTPYDPAFECLSGLVKQGDRSGLSITTGEVLDLTGKYSEQDGGSIVTKGASHMVMSALGKLGDSITLLERVDTTIADQELQYIDKRQLGDGTQYEVAGEEETVPWLPYFGGTVLRSDYYIAGAITEVNFNIKSGGAELSLLGLGAQSSVLTMNIAVDLRLVNSKSLEVVGTTSLQKQLVGEEVGGNVFRFFEDYIFDLNTGRRAQEPIQLGVRTTLDLAVYELIEEITKTDGSACIADVENELFLETNLIEKSKSPAEVMNSARIPYGSFI